MTGGPACPECGSPAVHAIRNPLTGTTRWTCLNAHTWVTEGGEEKLP